LRKDTNSYRIGLREEQEAIENSEKYRRKEEEYRQTEQKKVTEELKYAFGILFL
jgi:hypothetical protein